MKRYSDYSKLFNPTSDLYNDLILVTRITNRLAAKGLIQKNIYIQMDEYVDNLHIKKTFGISFHGYNKRFT